MAQSARIYLVENSLVRTVTLAEVQEKLLHYMDNARKTGAQLGWDYEAAAFPYRIEEKTSADNSSWLLLRGTDAKQYQYIIIGVGSDEQTGQETTYIQITLPEVATHGDKNKANEFARFLARSFRGELHLFNGRVQFFQPRKA
ncbi:DUF1885 family protein [Brevibacillus fulvus]|uniref:DUF1885 domain-containing protein n=1 Tax=Brevibacillus fulvus TaxID=1125967 RepID=A0A938XX49_9BACL|nr:DUF1885 family protein [Brevibacillus fulvus]MBM7589273.1 hypothetical protein [Brevibacillus fulvus]